LEPHHAILSTQRIVLASSSPRREEILSKARLPSFEIVPAECEENLDRAAYADRPWDYASDTAELKAQDVFNRLAFNGLKGDLDRDDVDKGLLVIGCDTVVALDGKIYGKPKSEDEARVMLRALSGKEHQVYSGVCMMWEQGLYEKETKMKKFHEETIVKFADLDEDVISGYVATKEPMDKAGSYGIQGTGGTLVKGIIGDYYNVMGFPLHRFCVEVVKWFKEDKDH